jgi:hypothetical protein
VTAHDKPEGLPVHHYAIDDYGRKLAALDQALIYGRLKFVHLEQNLEPVLV